MIPSSEKGSAECGRPQPEAKLLTPWRWARIGHLALHSPPVQVSFYNNSPWFVFAIFLIIQGTRTGYRTFRKHTQEHCNMDSHFLPIALTLSLNITYMIPSNPLMLQDPGFYLFPR